MNSITKTYTSNRIAGIDSFRALSLALIVLAHTNLFNYTSRHFIDIHVLINQGARFTIPFFTIISGYFWGLKISRSSLDQTSLNMCKRIFFIYLFWFIIYLFNPFDFEGMEQFQLLPMLKIRYWHFLRIIRDPVRLIFEGPKVHLWFLMSLLNSIIISWVFLKLNLKNWLVPAGFILYAFGLLAGAYAQSPFGFVIPFNTRNGPFFTTIFFALGWWFSTMSLIKLKLKWGILLAVFGFALHMIEVNYIWQQNGKFVMTDYLIGTLPWGVGATIIALNMQGFGKDTILPTLGKYTLGIYAIHFIFISLLSPINAMVDNFAWEIIFPIIVFALSVISVNILAKNNIIKRFVI